MSRRIITLIATVLGLALLIWQIEKIGLDAILDGLRRLGPAGLALILAASLLRQTLRTLAWTTLMGAGGQGSAGQGAGEQGSAGQGAVPLLSALAATISGDAIGNLTPLSMIVSEPAKAMYVRAHIPPQRALAALAAENFFYSLSVAVAVLLGVAVLFIAFPVPEPLRTASLILVAGMAAVLVAGLWLIAKEPALVSSTLGRFVSPRVVEKIRALETSSYGFVRSRPGRLAAVAACEIGFHVFSVAETWITLRFLGFDSLALAIVLDTVQRMINVVFRVVPLKLGVDEAASSITSSALGYGTALGVTMGVVRKVRVLIWAGAGLVIMASRKSEDRSRK